ncbi:hypothetical protein D5086_015891 [Populus alba]|uniref:Uncharacterized protein n=1 Tax=Populus alba TaxID=43335 RepID=A0ACC4BTY6_POPAL
MSLSFVFGMEADAVRFELPCNQECSSLWSPQKMTPSVKRGQKGSSHTCQSFYRARKKAWELGLWFGVVEIFGNLVGDGLMAMLGLASGQLAVKQDRSARENHRSGDPGKARLVNCVFGNEL